MSSIKDLAPSIVWHIFDEITQVPRPSKREGKIVAWLEKFADDRGLEYKKDAAGNVVIRKEATAGYESRPTVILQSHVDMVCEKNSDKVFDFDTDPIDTYIDGGWVKAHGTTLGADCGIGMAAALALLISDEAEHGALECLFTVDEETGLTGAFNLADDMLTGEILINLDSEDEGELFIGCAGGIDTVAQFKYTGEKPRYSKAYAINIKGLTGGHSGDDINRGLANSNRLMARILWLLYKKCGIELASIDGGNLRNAIPREATATITSDKPLHGVFAPLVEAIKDEFKYTEHSISITISDAATPAEVIDHDTARSLISVLYSMPNGVLAMSRSMEGLVETSTNLASVKMKEGSIVVTTSQRSSTESAKYDAAWMVESAFTLAGATVTHGDGYPGWAPDPSSPLIATSVRVYEEMFGQKPVVRAIHAGLECGLFLKKYPGLKMISFGPTIKGVHSPDERLDIASVGKFWDYTLQLLKEIR